MVAATSGLLLLGVLSAFLVPLPGRLLLPPSTVVTYADGSPAYVFLSPDEKYRIAVDLEEVDPHFVAALVRYEDKRFHRHLGVDPVAVLRAAALNLRHRRVVSGASTLTLQLVRLIEPRPRTVGSKLVEALRATQLEIRWSKEEILAAYLAFTPYGGNLEGLQAASFSYFGHSARDLAPEEIATLLAVPQSPRERFPSPENQSRLRQARDEIAAWLLEQGSLAGDREGEGRQVLAQVRAAPVPRAVRPMPKDAPHAAFWLRAGAASGHRVATTLDGGIQRLAGRLLAAVQAELARKGIHNGATVVVEHATGRVRALVGNFAFLDDQHGGQIPGFAAARSPGSALKPFLYALAVDRGLVLPEQLVPDVPTAYGSYAPDNYDGSFSGLVQLEEALSESLNVPFVRLLGDLGVERFLAFLRAAGVRGLEPTPGYYGLSAAIGALEVTPLEVAGLYAGLAEDGRTRRLTWRAGSAAGAVPRLYSPGAAYLTRRALSRRDRPDFPERRRISGAPPHVHWKTGTSYGHRDAWAVGSGPRYTVAVWLGNLDNRPSFDLVGAEAAGPLLFDLLEALADRSSPPLRFGPSEDLKPLRVCAYSGYLPTAACESTRSALALRARVPTRSCPYHVAVDVELATGYALNPGCRSGRPFETRSFLVWPSSVRRWLARGKRVLPHLPSLATGCRTPTKPGRLAILSPPAGEVLMLLPGLDPRSQEIPLEAEGQNQESQLSWFLDGEYLGTIPADERLWWTPTPGLHQLYVVDRAGRSASRRLEVRRR